MSETIENKNNVETKLNDLENAMEMKDHVKFYDLENAMEKKEQVVVEEDYTARPLIYGVNDNPPIHITIVCAFQQGLLSLSGQLIVSLLVAEAVCASDDNIFKARLLSSTLFMSGVTTVAMNLLGIRLPLFQGAASEYVIPLLLVANVQGSFCSSIVEDEDAELAISNVTAMTSNFTEEEHMERILTNVRTLSGSLMLAGFIHGMLGFTGLIGVLLRFVGPLTIVPTMILLFIFIVRPVLKFVEVNWGIAVSTIAIACILFLYLSKYNMPVPVWTPSGGFRVIRYPLHQVFAILISILINWALCGILTNTGVFTDDPKDIGFDARTDARASVITNNPWFTFPYPGQYGPVGFSGPALISCLIATLISVLDSVGDYYACAKVCRVPPPPAHAVNRGIFIEGMCSMLSGAVGAGHATTTYGGNIGAIGVTKVASRRVFLFTGILYILFGIFGKFSAVFITIPYPVLGGAIVVMFGIFFGVVCSNLEVTNMSSPRNIAILGLSVFIGLMVPTWVEKVKTPVESGNEAADRIISMLLGNPTLVGTCIACFLDNTVPGTREERGIAAWHVGNSETDLNRSLYNEGHEVYNPLLPINGTREERGIAAWHVGNSEADLNRSLYNEGHEVYNPMLPKRLLQMSIMKYIPFLPYRRREALQK